MKVSLMKYKICFCDDNFGKIVEQNDEHYEN